ncbi:unnamed protein product, partial [Protopolystoma xenopodis]
MIQWPIFSIWCFKAISTPKGSRCLAEHDQKTTFHPSRNGEMEIPFTNGNCNAIDNDDSIHTTENLSCLDNWAAKPLEPYFTRANGRGHSGNFDSTMRLKEFGWNSFHFDKKRSANWPDQTPKEESDSGPVGAGGNGINACFELGSRIEVWINLQIHFVQSSNRRSA